MRVLADEAPVVNDEGLLATPLGNAPITMASWTGSESASG